MERMLKRMKLPLPAGVDEPCHGVRACLRADWHLKGTVTTMVFDAFSRGAGASEFDPMAAEGWVVVVTQRTTRSEAKKRARHLGRLVFFHDTDRTSAGDALGHDETPEAAVLREEASARSRRRLETVLTGFSPTDRELLQARVLDNTPYEELAVAFHCTPAALRQRFTRLLQRARLRATSRTAQMAHG